MNCDFLMEKKLETQAPELARIFKANVLCCQNMLNRFRAIFPNYTDHSALHSLEVIAFANQLIAGNIGKMNVDEIFVLLMAAYLHDSGMGISEKDYEQFCPKIPGCMEFIEKHPEEGMAETVRTFHNEFSGQYIRKYAPLFDFPSEGHLFAVIQASRGHRKTDLYDEKEYPADLKLPNGNTVCLPYIAALIRLADELDIAADRNLLFMYDTDEWASETSRREFAKHKAIRFLDIEEERFCMRVHADSPQNMEDLLELKGKVNETLAYCREVAEKRTPYRITQKKVDMINI